MKKLSSKLESTRKTEQDSQSQSQSQLVQGQSQRILVRVGSGFLGWVTG